MEFWLPEVFWPYVTDLWTFRYDGLSVRIFGITSGQILYNLLKVGVCQSVQ